MLRYLYFICKDNSRSVYITIHSIHFVLRINRTFFRFIGSPYIVRKVTYVYIADARIAEISNLVVPEQKDINIQQLCEQNIDILIKILNNVNFVFGQAFQSVICPKDEQWWFGMLRSYKISLGLSRAQDGFPMSFFAVRNLYVTRIK